MPGDRPLTEAWSQSYVMVTEQVRLNAAREQGVPWKKWGPYLSERQWGTVREDYSSDGNAWNYFSHDQARSRAYRWGEDGLAGISDDKQQLCFALALWNARDPILKERLFGLTNSEGNHGEDVNDHDITDAAPSRMLRHVNHDDASAHSRLPRQCLWPDFEALVVLLNPDAVRRADTGNGIILEVRVAENVGPQSNVRRAAWPRRTARAHQRRRMASSHCATENSTRSPPRRCGTGGSRSWTSSSSVRPRWPRPHRLRLRMISWPVILARCQRSSHRACSRMPPVMAYRRRS